MSKTGIKQWRGECLVGIEIVEHLVEKLRDTGDKAETSQKVFLTEKVNDLIHAICGTKEDDLEVAD